MRKLFLMIAMLLSLAACSEGEGASTPSSLNNDAYARTEAEARGFKSGTSAAPQTVYIYFDAQCHHCGELWSTMKSLQSKLNVVWIPVGLLNPASISQGVTILTAPDPVKTMNEHETMMTGGRRGISAQVPSSQERAIIEANTSLFQDIGGTAIPLIISKNPKTGALIQEVGSLPVSQLRQVLSLN